METCDALVSVGIDVGKETLVVSGLAAEGDAFTGRPFSNTRPGIARMITFLDDRGMSSEVPCVLESTGDYHFLLCCLLTDAGYRVRCINPLISKRYQRYSIRNAKADSVDAARLADIGLKEKGLFVFTPNIDQIALKRRATLCANLEHTGQKLKASVKRAKALGEELGFYIDLSRAEEAIALLGQQRDKLMEEITERTDRKTKELAEATPGLSLQFAALIALYLNDKKFKNRNALVAFCGLDVRARRSSNWQGIEKLSKRSNPYLRKALYFVGLNLMQHHPEYRAYFLELRSRGLPPKACIIAVARRFLRVTWWKHYYGAVDRGQVFPTAPTVSSIQQARVVARANRRALAGSIPGHSFVRPELILSSRPCTIAVHGAQSKVKDGA